MIIKLPIVNNGKINITLFRLIKFDNYFILSLFENIIEESIHNKDILKNNNKDILKNNNKDTLKNNNKDTLIKILVSNNINALEYLNIYVPLKLNIIDSYLLSNYFFTINIISNLKHHFDFFFNLNEIMKTNFNLQFIPIDKFNNYHSNIIEFINYQYNIINTNKKFNKDFWDMINLLMNAIAFNLYMKENKTLTVKIIKKIQMLTNNFKNFKYSINYSNKYTIEEHLNNIQNNVLQLDDIEIDHQYFLLIDNIKILFVKILSKNNNIITLHGFSNIDFNKYKWYKYSPDTKLHFNMIYLHFINNNAVFKIIINKYIPKLNIDIIDNIILYFKEDQIKSNLYTFILENNEHNNDNTNLEIIKSNSFTIDYFKLICNNSSTSYILILETLLSNYTYPIKYNKKEIDTIFDNILYLSLIHIDTILICTNEHKLYLNNNLTIPFKLKQLYFNILKTFYQIINNNNYTIKYTTDNIHIQFIKIFLTSKSITYDLLKSITTDDTINKFKNILLINFFINDIINKLTWNNMNNRLSYLKILLKHKEHIFYYDKLNKNLFPEHFDNRIKSIIINPTDMFKYLITEQDFINWVYFLEDKCSDLYIKPISLSTEDFNILGKMIYNLINVKEQTLNDKYYKQFIIYGTKFPKIILDNLRINLQIKDKIGYLKCNINLGILAKHLTQNNNIEKISESTIIVINKPVEMNKPVGMNKPVEMNKLHEMNKPVEMNKLHEMNDIDKINKIHLNENEIKLLKHEIYKLTNKYLKYKNKYNKIKSK